MYLTFASPLVCWCVLVREDLEKLGAYRNCDPFKIWFGSQRRTANCWFAFAEHGKRLATASVTSSNFRRRRPAEPSIYFPSAKSVPLICIYLFLLITPRPNPKKNETPIRPIALEEGRRRQEALSYPQGMGERKHCPAGLRSSKGVGRLQGYCSRR